MHIRKQSEKLFTKMIDFIYLIRYITLAQARLKAKCLIADDKVTKAASEITTGRFMRGRSPHVCPAFCDRSYEGEEAPEWRFDSECLA